MGEVGRKRQRSDFQFLRAYDSVYEFEFCFWQGNKRSATAPDSVARENQPWGFECVHKLNEPFAASHSRGTKKKTAMRLSKNRTGRRQTKKITIFKDETL